MSGQTYGRFGIPDGSFSIRSPKSAANSKASPLSCGHFDDAAGWFAGKRIVEMPFPYGVRRGKLIVVGAYRIILKKHKLKYLYLDYGSDSCIIKGVQI